MFALDWVEVRSLYTLCAVAVIRGRAGPLLWAKYPEWELNRSQNCLEEVLLRLLRTLLPAKFPVILLVNRGFGRTELAGTCQQLGYQYLIRIKPEMHIQAGSCRGKLSHYSVKKGLPARRDECWFLMTNLDRSAPALVKPYAQRMTIEQVYRDQKIHRNGVALRDIFVRAAERFDRLLLIHTLAYLLLLGLGLHAHQCSVFTIGRRMLDQIHVPIPKIPTALVKAIYDAAPNWG